MAGQGQLSFSLDGVGQAQHRQRHASLSQAANGAQRLLPVGQKHRIEILLLGQAGDAHLDLGNDAEAPFRTHEDFA